MSIERHFDVPLIASLALKEKQIQQNYRPVIAVHKWFARRPGTLFRGLLLSEFIDRRLDETYFNAHDFEGKAVADPFMGGGSPLIEANRIGCDVMGFDINPMSKWIVGEEITTLDQVQYRSAANKLLRHLEDTIGDLYRTDCPLYGDRNVPAKYFMWVKTLPCTGCGYVMDLFPGYLLADNTRHPANVLICGSCGDLNEVENVKEPRACHSCSTILRLDGPAKRNKCACPNCGLINKYPRPKDGAPTHRLFAIEYFNARRKDGHKGRFFKKPDKRDLRRVAEADAHWRKLKAKFVPEQAILPGDESDRLHRWGYFKYREMFNTRQLLGLELSARQIAATKICRIRSALSTNLSDLLRYQNMLCRYDTMALKSLDVFSIHGFPVGLVQVESNLIGFANPKGASVGSGGWLNIIEKYAKAKRYCDDPFEVQHRGGRKVRVPITGEWIGESRKGTRSRKVDLSCVSSAKVTLEPGTLDAVFTDPPYLGNVQYAELMDFCFAWLRKLARQADGFDRVSTRAAEELTANYTEGRGLEHFTEGLARVYTAMAKALKRGAPLAFTYHHNRLEAYHAVGVAVLDAGLTCSASIPCPAEMGGSIHIHGTNSSIIDSVFVCRSYGEAKKTHLFGTMTELARVVRNDLGQLRVAGVKATRGDIRCIVFGHLTRMSIWNLRSNWDASSPTAAKLERFAASLATFGDHASLIEALAAGKIASTMTLPFSAVDERDAIAF